MKKKRVHVLINPISGNGSHLGLKDLLVSKIDRTQYEVLPCVWQTEEDLKHFTVSDNGVVVIAKGAKVGF